MSNHGPETQIQLTINFMFPCGNNFMKCYGNKESYKPWDSSNTLIEISISEISGRDSEALAM